jgi:hypothetical protein
MAPESPWFLITHNELLEIEEWLHHLESWLPEASLQQIGKIHSVLYEVRDRQP